MKGTENGQCTHAWYITFEDGAKLCTDCGEVMLYDVIKQPPSSEPSLRPEGKI